VEDRGAEVFDDGLLPMIYGETKRFLVMPWIMAPVIA